VKARTYFAVAALSLSLLALELAWTRVFSAEFFYTFAFLVLSLAILGLGLGALAVHLIPGLGRPNLLGMLLCLTALMSLAAPPLVFRLGLDFTQIFHNLAMILKLLLALSLVNGAFFFGGMALAVLLRRDPNDLPRLYMADLLGAAAGVPAILLLMGAFGTPVATFLCAVPVLCAASVVCRRWWKIAPLLLAVAIVPLALHAETLLEQRREERAPISYKHWDAMAKVKILEVGEGYRTINLDNVANSTAYEFDGNWDRPDSLRFQFGIDVSWLLERLPRCTFLSLGAGGGADVLQALQAGATEVHAVEVVPHVNRLMTTGELAAFTGFIYQDPRVKVVTEDGRAYVRRHPSTFDFIYSLSSNSWAALASGAFALAENYLFTTEAFRDYWRALTDRGYMMMEHQYYMPRLVTEVMDALKELGVEDPTAHFAVYNLPSMRRRMVLLSKQPLTDEVRTHAFGELTPEIAGDIHLLYPPAEGREGNLIDRIVREGWRSVSADTTIDLSPNRDDRPFPAQMGLWKNFRFERLQRVLPYEMAGFPVSKLLIIVIAVVIALLVLPLNLLPYLRGGPKLRPVPWLYFFAIGAGFMVVEVILIQKYALFIGPSVYSMVVVLMTLLLASGVGSRFSRWGDERVVFLGIVAWLLLDVFLFRHAPYVLTGLPVAGRMLVSAALIAPVGFLMGMPFPKGGLRVGDLIPWGLAVNGMAAVLGSALIVLVALTHGFSVALLIGAALYGLAFLLYARESAWRGSPGS
jgi:predicted membrane-bound spermidine synthase